MRISYWSSDVCSSDLDALDLNGKIEFERNKERYGFLRWGQKAFENFKVVPPSTGIVHQVNLENLARVVMERDIEGETWALPDTVFGTDSHTTMINGIGVFGWGVCGIEAEAAMLGQADRQSTRPNPSHSCSSRKPTTACKKKNARIIQLLHNITCQAR